MPFIWSAILYGVLTGLGKGAFFNCDSLTSVTIPDGVTSIGNYAFFNCDSLTSVTIGNGVTSIGGYAFEDCAAEIIWGATPTITEIGNYAFAGYAGTSITIPDGVTSIGISAFEDCTSLTSVTIGNGVTSIGGSAFWYCFSLEAVYITNIGKWAEIDFGSSAANPLYYAGNLYLNGELVTDLVIPDGVTSIGMYAFGYCDSLTSVTIGNGVTSIGELAFGYCTSLERLTVAPGNPVYRSAGNCIIETEAGTLIQGCNNSVIPSDGSVTSIGDYAFAYCTSLASVAIPDSVTSIGGSAFDNCTSLTSVTIPDSVTSIGIGAFAGCTSLTSVTIPDSVTSMGGSAFYNCNSLTSIVIPDSVTSIGENAFYNCNSLTSIVIPDSVTSIGDSAFRYCYKLVEVHNKSSLDVTAGSSSYGYVGYYAKHVYTEENDSWLTDTENGFRFLYDGETGYLVAYLGSETELTLPESFTAYDGTGVTNYQIYERAFYGRDDLTAITIADSVTSIGGYAFSGCTAEIIWGGTPAITEIGYSAFSGYDGMRITIPDSVTSIGWSAFRDCTSLTSVTFEGTMAEWNSVYKGSSWKHNCPFTEVVCSDGVADV